MKNISPFYYVIGKDAFYDTGKGGQLLGKLKAMERLVKTGVFEEDSEALEYLESIMSSGITEEELSKLKSKSKGKPGAVDWDSIYNEMQAMFPFYSRVSAKGERQIYFADEINQVSLVHYEDDDSLINSLMHNKEIWIKLKTYYKNCELLHGHKEKIDLKTFIIKIVKHHLLLDETKLIEEQPKSFSWNLEELAFKKFNQDSVAPGETPTWDEFTSRLNYPDVFKAWVWSLFTPDNNIRQAMWLTGAGNDGKSAVQKALRDIFGHAHVYDCKKGDENRQWFQANVYGKSLVNYADCDNPYLLNNQAIKQLTGGDSTSIEGKGVNAFSGEIYAKLFISSNMPPRINPDMEAQTSRLIRLKVAPIAPGAPKDEQFKARLIEEAYAFLWQCRESYKTMINSGRDALILPTQLRKDIENECATDNYYILQEFVEKNIEYGPQFYCKPSDVNKCIKEYVTLEQYMDSSKAKFFQQDFETKIASKSIRMQNLSVKGSNVAAYVGFRLKHASDCVLDAPND